MAAKYVISITSFVSCVERERGREGISALYLEEGAEACLQQGRHGIVLFKEVPLTTNRLFSNTSAHQLKVKILLEFSLTHTHKLCIRCGILSGKRLRQTQAAGDTDWRPSSVSHGSWAVHL